MCVGGEQKNPDTWVLKHRKSVPLGKMETGMQRNNDLVPISQGILACAIILSNSTAWHTVE